MREQKKKSWAVTFHHSDKPDEVKLYTTMRKITADLGLSIDRIFYLHKRQKEHTEYKQKKTIAMAKRLTINRVRNEDDLQKIFQKAYCKSENTLIH